MGEEIGNNGGQWCHPVNLGDTENYE